MEAEILLLTPSLSLPGIRESPPGSSWPLLTALQWSPLSPTKGSPRKHWERARNPSHPPPQSVLGGRDMWKGPGELLMIQSEFSTDAFRQRGLQVSTWFGFGSLLPSS